MWNQIEANPQALATYNPIREALLKIKPNPALPAYNLILGDPSVYPGFECHPKTIEILTESMKVQKNHGYTMAFGNPESCQALANFYSNQNLKVTADDVIIQHGASGCIWNILTALTQPGQNILVPAPGFPLYEAICINRGVTAKKYQMIADKQWEIDMEQLETLVDDKTKCLVIINPSNPCGSVWSKQHMEQILEFCERHKLPILADEVYAKMTVKDVQFISFAELTQNVPVLVVCSFAKRWMVPGWRIGWVVKFDRNKYLDSLWIAMKKCANILIHPCSFIMKSVPEILNAIDQEYFDQINKRLEESANYVYEETNKIRGLKVNLPQGAMYMMVKVDFSQFKDITTSQEFVEKLAAEKAVTVLPGEALYQPGFFRLITCIGISVYEKVFELLRQFCEEHYA